MSGSAWGDFLKEKTFGGGYNRLRNWKEDGEIVVWIHTKTLIHKRLFHMVPYVGQREDEDTGKKKTSILYLPFVCHEDVNEYLRLGKNFEPMHCPLCRFIEHLKNNGNIADGETVWDSSIGDRKRDRVCTKADFVGDTDGGGDWRLTFKPSIQYILAVIDNDHPGDGISIAAEKFSLGEKIKSAVQKEIDRRGPDEGDPDRNPYAFKFVFNSKSRTPSDYYDAYPLDRIEMTAEIEELLGQDAQDLSAWISPGDTKILREAMEAHVTVDDVDFDDLFDNVLENVGTKSDESEEAPKSKPKSKPKAKPKERKVSKERKVAKEPEPEPDPEPETQEDDTPMMECPSCRGKGKKKNGKECKVCDGTGQVEAPDDDEEEEAPTPPPPKQTKGRTKERKVAPPEPEEEEKSQDDEEDVAECARCHKDVAMSATSCPHCGATFQ